MAELYDGPIVDAHHHFWDPQANYHPWLAEDAKIPFRYGDYSAIKRRYLPADYFGDVGAHRVVETVYVETEWDPRDPLGETRFVHHLAERHGAPTRWWRRPGWTRRTPPRCWRRRRASHGSAASATSPAVRNARNRSASCAA